MKRIAVACALVLLAACSGSSDDGASPAGSPDVVPTTSPSSSSPSSRSTTVAEPVEPSIAHLAPGTHIGIAGFSPPDDEVADEWLRRWDEANDASTVGRILVDWVDVEPRPGEYDTTALVEQLEAAVDHGQQPMVTIAAVDVSGTPFPAWLNVGLAEFRAGPASVAYNAMVDHIAPLLEQYGVWLLAVANEPPFEEGLDRQAFADFVASVRSHAQDALPDLHVSFVFAGHDALSDEPGSDALRSAGSLLATNHYCLDPLLNAVPLAEVEGRIDSYIERADGRPVVFQEFGCPAAELVGSSDANQAAWFSTAFEVIKDRPAVRAAFVFEFLDWSDELVDISYGDAIAAEPELEEFFGRFRSWLLTTGLFRADMTPRPAWDVYLSAARR